MKRALTVYYSEQDGELVSVEMAENFRQSLPLLRADVLLDLIHSLMDTYNKTVKETFDAKTQKTHAL